MATRQGKPHGKSPSERAGLKQKLGNWHELLGEGNQRSTQQGGSSVSGWSPFGEPVDIQTGSRPPQVGRPSTQTASGRSVPVRKYQGQSFSGKQTKRARGKTSSDSIPQHYRWLTSSDPGVLMGGPVDVDEPTDASAFLADPRLPKVSGSRSQTVNARGSAQPRDSTSGTGIGRLANMAKESIQRQWIEPVKDFADFYTSGRAGQDLRDTVRGMPLLTAGEVADAAWKGAKGAAESIAEQLKPAAMLNPDVQKILLIKAIINAKQHPSGDGMAADVARNISRDMTAPVDFGGDPASKRLTDLGTLPLATYLGDEALGGIKLLMKSVPWIRRALGGYEKLEGRIDRLPTLLRIPAKAGKEYAENTAMLEAQDAPKAIASGTPADQSILDIALSPKNAGQTVSMIGFHGLGGEKAAPGKSASGMSETASMARSSSSPSTRVQTATPSSGELQVQPSVGEHPAFRQTRPREVLPPGADRQSPQSARPTKTLPPTVKPMVNETWATRRFGNVTIDRVSDRLIRLQRPDGKMIELTNAQFPQEAIHRIEPVRTNRRARRAGLQHQSR